ncbi:MAG: right-handed parallel beta-helix repeat-containing protein [Methylocella sp.]
MTKITSLPTIAGALLALGLSAAPAAAQANGTWVSGHGTDSGGCGPVTAPCRTFAFALTQTNAGGVIVVLDPAGYGAVTITKAISILNDGVGTAGMQVSSGNAITINAGASDSVHLRGLTIEGLGSGANGILFNTGGNLAIENCVIRGFAGNGINIAPTGSVVVTGVLRNVITDNNSNGIIVSGSASTGGSLKVTIVDSVASNNNVGIFAGSASGFAATAIMLRNSVASNNFIGLEANTIAVLRVGHSVVTGNGTGVGNGIDSYGDNDIDGNTINILGELNVIPTH